MLWLKFIAEGY